MKNKLNKLIEKLGVFTIMNLALLIPISLISLTMLDSLLIMELLDDSKIYTLYFVVLLIEGLFLNCSLRY